MRPSTALGAASLIILVSLGCSGHDGGEGPLRGPTDVRTKVGGTLPAGETYVVGIFIPRNKSGHDATLERLEPADAGRAAGLRLRYAAVHLHQRGCQIGSAHGWLPESCKGRVHPVKGFLVRNGWYAGVLVGARSNRVGHWLIPSFRLRYRIGDREYATTYAQAMEIRFRPASTKFVFFRTPSRNIRCVFQTVDLYLRCDVRSGLKRPPPKTKGCQYDWTFGYELGPVGGARTACAGETVRSPTARTIGYGGTWRGGPFVCRSRRAGLRCHSVNPHGRGFFLSNQHSYRF